LPACSGLNGTKPNVTAGHLFQSEKNTAQLDLFRPAGDVLQASNGALRASNLSCGPKRNHASFRAKDWWFQQCRQKAPRTFLHCDM